MNHGKNFKYEILFGNENGTPASGGRLKCGKVEEAEKKAAALLLQYDYVQVYELETENLIWVNGKWVRKSL